MVLNYSNGVKNMETHSEDDFANYFEQSILDYKQGSSRIQKQLPKMTQGYFNFTESCFEEGAIAEKEKQLMALGISIYLKQARKLPLQVCAGYNPTVSGR